MREWVQAMYKDSAEVVAHTGTAASVLENEMHQVLATTERLFHSLDTASTGMLDRDRFEEFISHPETNFLFNNIL